MRIVAPFIGGSFGGKGSILSDTVAASLAARLTGRPVKVAMTRPQMFNNTTRRAATIQRIRIGATHDGAITAMDTKAGRRLDSTPVLIIDGEKDSRRSPGDGLRLAERLVRAGALVAHHVLPIGHSITAEDKQIAIEWLQAIAR